MLKEFLFLFLYLATCVAIAQKPTKIRLVNADVLEYDEQMGSKTKRLKGNVAFKHDQIYMYCDSAYLYSETNVLDAFGNVHIKEGDSLNVYGNYLQYNGDEKKIEIKNSVRLIHRNVKLTTDYLVQDLNTDIASYTTGGEIIDGDNNLFSEIGDYNSKTSQFFFKDSVVLINPEYTMNSDTLNYHSITETAYFFGPTTINSDSNVIYCENGWYDTKKNVAQFNENAVLTSKEQSIKGDSLYYDRKNGYGEAHGNIVIHDTVQNVLISGDYAEYFEKENIAMVTKQAMLTDIYETDSLFMHADTFKTAYDSSKVHRILYAYNKVKFYKTDLQGICDSVIYTYKDSTIQLYTDPVLWSDENQMTSDYIEIKTDSNGIQFITFENNAFITSFVDSSKYNQIKGKNMICHFNENELKVIDVTGNGQTIYYAQQEDSSFIGVNKAECSNMRIYVDSNEIQEITFITKPDAILYPLDKIAPEDLVFKGFRWIEDRRPLKKEDIFVWR